MELERTDDGIYVTVHNGFSAILSPRPTCPPVVQFVDPPTAQTDGTLEVGLAAFAPWRKNWKPVRVQVDVVGLADQPAEVTLPGRAVVPMRADAAPGWYKLLVTGGCLRGKRWIKQDLSSDPQGSIRYSIPDP